VKLIPPIALATARSGAAALSRPVSLRTPPRQSTWCSGLKPDDVIGRDKIGGALADHDRGRVDVPARDFGHDARIGDPQVRDPEDTQAWVDDAADSARAAQVIDAHPEVPNSLARLLANNARDSLRCDRIHAAA